MSVGDFAELDGQMRVLLGQGVAPEVIADRFGRLADLDRVEVLAVLSRAWGLVSEMSGDFSGGGSCPVAERGDVTDGEVGAGAYGRPQQFKSNAPDTGAEVSFS